MSDDPPDAEVLVVDRADGAVSTIRVEVAQCGRYSKNVYEVIHKKLLKRYHQGTVIVVLVEESPRLSVADLFDFIRDNNLQNQRVYIVGAGTKPGSIKFMPCFEVQEPGTDELALMEMDVDVDQAGKGYLGYEGVVFKPPWSPRARYAFPVFVKKMALTR